MSASEVVECTAVTFELSMNWLTFACSTGASAGPKPTYADIIYTLYIHRQGAHERIRRLALLAIILVVFVSQPSAIKSIAL